MKKKNRKSITIVKTPQNLPQPPTFTTSHHKQPPSLKNEEEDTTFSTILERILLELKIIWRCMRRYVGARRMCLCFFFKKIV